MRDNTPSFISIIPDIEEINDLQEKLTDGVRLVKHVHDILTPVLMRINKLKKEVKTSKNKLKRLWEEEEEEEEGSEDHRKKRRGMNTTAWYHTNILVIKYIVFTHVIAIGHTIIINISELLLVSY